MNLSSELRIETPEGIRFSYPLAGPITRCLAWVVDLLVIILLQMLCTRVINVLGLLNPDLAGLFSLVLFFGLSIGYGVAMEWAWRGQTLGKRMLRLRVMDRNGFRLRFYQVLFRNLLRLVDALPSCYFVGGLATLATRDCQRLGDLAANTVVVHHTAPAAPDLRALLAGKYNSLRTAPHLAARLRQQVSPGEASLALEALLRREEYDDAARLELYRELADHFRGLVTFPPELVEMLSDEQYLRNVADLLFRPHEVRSAGARPAADG